MECQILFFNLVNFGFDPDLEEGIALTQRRLDDSQAMSAQTPPVDATTSELQSPSDAGNRATVAVTSQLWGHAMFPTCPSFGNSLMEFGVVESKYEKAPRKTLTTHRTLWIRKCSIFVTWIIVMWIVLNALMECQSLMFLDESHTWISWSKAIAKLGFTGNLAMADHKEPREVYNVAIVFAPPDTRHSIIFE
jgi:hypothetical protein